TPERFEVSPVLKLIFSVEDAEAVNAAFDELLEDAAKGHPHDSELLVDDQRSEEAENEGDL
ncbi:MAG: hypothetical protein RR772_04370, partial [Gordonibacter sp.]